MFTILSIGLRFPKCIVGSLVSTVLFMLLLTMPYDPTQCITAATPAQQPTESKESRNPLLEVAKASLQKKNPKISLIAITHLEAWDKGGGSYVMICWGCVQDRVFRGDFSDELFGFFIVNKSLTRILRTLDIVNTPRWNDYDFYIKELTVDLITIAGKGEMYGDQPRLHKYKWDPYSERK